MALKKNQSCREAVVQVGSAGSIPLTHQSESSLLQRPRTHFLKFPLTPGSCSGAGHVESRCPGPMPARWGLWVPGCYLRSLTRGSGSGLPGLGSQHCFLSRSGHIFPAGESWPSGRKGRVILRHPNVGRSAVPTSRPVHLGREGAQCGPDPHG